MREIGRLGLVDPCNGNTANRRNGCIVDPEVLHIPFSLWHEPEERKKVVAKVVGRPIASLKKAEKTS
ncbi:hypothetical protein MAMC_00793 [Methylacidimicrobium cyclopophantes]|uniref:Uncharacterized protein n=1 Tax=Methylacidimicrobium cyclopophantes TaxID=1041766 RepID=A0A5E6MBT2_9BACT|nr:hypothetical protein MAMC_00793 [Methylacidimicrobium cyclopophantes]